MEYVMLCLQLGLGVYVLGAVITFIIGMLKTSNSIAKTIMVALVWPIGVLINIV